MAWNTMQELTPVEKNMPLAKYYYDYPMKDLSDELKKEIMGHPMNPDEVIKPENFTDWLLPVGEYNDHENGYCMLPDGTGYIATYMRMPDHVKPFKIFWYLNWLNTHPKSQPAGTGNLRYKIWNPADHWDHYFINWEDKSEGIHTTESLDLGEGDRQYDTIRHQFNLREYGLTQEKIDQINDNPYGYKLGETSDFESFDEAGFHLTLGQIRPTADGGYERRSAEWIGWRPKNGELVRDTRTKCSEEYLRKVAYHTLIEWYHLMDYINDLWEEYHDLPIDAD